MNEWMSRVWRDEYRMDALSKDGCVEDEWMSRVWMDEYRMDVRGWKS